MKSITDVLDERTFYIHWTVNTLFLPYGRVEAIFRQEFPTLTEWKATLRPTESHPREWKMVFSLQAVRPDEDEYVVLVDRMVVKIESLEESEIIEQDEGYSFHAGNEHTFQMAPVNIKPGGNAFNIEINLHFPRLNLELADSDLDFYNRNRFLPNRLLELFFSKECSDWRLFSVAPRKYFSVHSCIIGARWDNFSFDSSNPRRVETDISLDVLKDILKYMYSGIIFSVSVSVNKSDEYITELFQVMSKHRLHHLLDNFTMNPPVRFFRTSVGHHHHHEVFPMDMIGNEGYRWRENPMPGVEVNCSVLFKLDEGNCDVEYKLELISGNSLYARVTVEFEDEDESTPFHDHDFELSDIKNVESNSYQFEGDLRSYVVECRTTYTEPSPVFHFHFYFTDGNHVTEFLNKTTHIRRFIASSRRLKSFKVLNDHMYRLMLQREEGDLEVEFSDDPECSEIEYLHKAIFVAALPDWRSVVEEDVPENVEIPNRVRCKELSCKAFQLVIPTLYTEKCDPVPNEFFDELLTFATIGGHKALKFALTEQGKFM